MTAYYNEIDPYAAEWLRRLISAGLIADGVVDERSISDVRPNELYEFTQCHFFAGIGVWSHALRGAGFPDTRPVWTGSCPCQPFSNAGSRKGVTDERHLWPHWFHLIEECRPPTVFGEQVASKDGLGWIDLVQADMEGADYAIGAFDLCAAGFGAPHIRQRLWFVADTDNPRSQGRISGRTDSERQDQHRHVGRSGSTIGMGNSDIDDGRHEHSAVTFERETRLEHGGSSSTGRMVNTDNGGSQGSGETGVGQGVEQSGSQLTGTGSNVGMGNAQHDGQSTVAEPRGDDPDASDDPKEQVLPMQFEGASIARHDRSGDGRERGSEAQTRAKETNGHWGNADWLLCRDEKWRPVEPSTFPLVDGATARVGRLRAYGNAITAQVAQGLIESYMEGT